MRQIRFRGRSLRTGEWLYGDLLRNENGAVAVVPPFKLNKHNECSYYEVDADTVGQFIGVTDKNGKEIYEGDIILYGNTIKNVVVFRHGAFGYLVDGFGFISYAGNTNFTFNPLDRSKEHEVIGNIFDNPDLLNGK